MPVFSIAKNNINQKQLSAALNFIDDYWQNLQFSSRQDQGTLIGLPESYLVPSSQPNKGFVYKEMYYWDSYFLVEAMLAKGETKQAKGIVDNLLFMLERFGLIPNANRYYMLSRSQPPLLTTMILSVAERLNDESWKERAMALASEEYANVWLGRTQPHHRLVYKGLSRYYDINVLHQLAEAESGWDYTPRFDGRCLDFLPVDLNSYLHKYETDLANFTAGQEQAEWLEKARKRAKTMKKLMWDEASGLYLDYDFINHRRGGVQSLASYMPMFCGLLSVEEAERARLALARFETDWGLSATALGGGMHVGQQWALPNGWAPLHYLTIKGLEKYGYYEDAARICEKWLKLNLKIFRRTGKFYEKYNVIDGTNRPAPGVYPDQIGFGWTNAVFMLLAKEYMAR